MEVASFFTLTGCGTSDSSVSLLGGRLMITALLQIMHHTLGDGRFEYVT